jgi:hypothetical protein
METTPTEAQVQAFVTKLEAFAASLSAEEQTVFQIILAGGLGIVGDHLNSPPKWEKRQLNSPPRDHVNSPFA